MNHEEIIKRLREPFSYKEIEWKIQVTTNDKAKGMAVPYMDARAVQKRLDDVAGPFNWKNLYSTWHNNSQICGISIFNAERGEWVTKFDGAENSDIEPIKGGLSDSFKRAASVWGVGRYLYEMEGIWVDIEAKGKSSAIKQNQYGRLESEYNAAVGKIFGKQGVPAPASAATPAPEEPANDFKVQSVKPSGKSSQVLELVGGNGEVVTAYVKASDHAITTGSRLLKVQMVKKNSDYGEYNLITDYKAA
jgi:hypothetical protein